ncbi:MAG: dolichol monophosphate mannose synthase [Ponticaulis sp.]|nr:dolichol monophosphate mannose synthase [Ponticaulis sp.]
MSDMLQVSLILPTRNEAGNIAEAIERAQSALSGLSFEVIVVDDDSPDGTADIVRSIAAKDARIRVIQRIGRRGLASACIEGALCAAGQVVAIMDADLQHDETVLPKLIKPVLEGRADLAVGTRYAQGGGTADWSAKREAQSEWATRLAQRFIKAPLSDPMSGFFAIGADRFRELVPHLSGRGFKILLDIVFSSRDRLRLHEEPFVFRGREAGESKLDAPTAVQYLMMIYDRLMGHIVPARFALFAIVGGAGVFIHMAILAGLFQVAGVNFIISQSVAVIAAMTFNFLLNNMLTFHDVRLKGWGLLKGWLSFCLVCGLGAIANVGVASYLFSETGVIWTLSALAGILVGAVWNYVMSSRFTWGQL